MPGLRQLAAGAVLLALGCGPEADAAPPTRVVCHDGVRIAKVNGVKRRGICDLDEAVNRRCRFGLVVGQSTESVAMEFGQRMVTTSDGKRWRLRCRRSGLSRPGPGY
jgi:hypothetical protein